MLDTKPRPKSKQAKPASGSVPRTGPGRKPQGQAEGRAKRRGSYVRGDVILGAATGFAVALGFGGPIFATLGGFWSGIVLPAFYNLAQSGLPFCG